MSTHADDNNTPLCDTVRASTIISPLLRDIGFRSSRREPSLAALGIESRPVRDKKLYALHKLNII